MANISTSIELYDRLSAPINNMIGAINNMIGAYHSLDRAMDTGLDPGQIHEAEAALIRTQEQVDQLGDYIRQNEQQQENFNNKVRKGSSDMDGLANKVMGLVGAYGSLQGVKKVLDLSDEYSQTNARLSMIADSQNDVASLQDKIFQSAQRSRASYSDTADMVAKLSLRTGDLFSNDEAIAFAETVNKSFVIAGASQQEMASASLQLTQALGSGVLRGEEFNAIFEAAPNIIQTIAEHMGVTVGEMRALAADGQITADVIKEAMLGSAGDIDTTFQNMPYTWGQVWTTLQNVLLEAFQPLLQIIGNAANWIGENWSTIEPIFWGLAAAVGVLATAFAIWKVVTLAQTFVQWALNSAMLACPLFWIVLIIAAVVAAIVVWIKKMGGLKVAWLIVVNALMTAWDWVKIGFFTGIYWVIGLWEEMQYKFKAVGTAIANFMGDMKASVMMILQNMVNGAIKIINGFIETLNKIPGVSIGTIAEVTFGTNAQLENEAEKQARNDALADYRAELDAKAAEREASLNQMKADAVAATASRQAEIDAARAEAASEDSTSLEEMASSGAATAANTGAMADSMEITNEDLKYLRDIAEQETVNRFTTAEIKVDMTNNNNISKDMDLDGVVDYLTNGVNEAMEKAAEGVYD